jgi:hypothetical protein
MHFEAIPLQEKVTETNVRVERLANRFVRSYDDALGRLRLGGRKGAYDDHRYEFAGGAKETLRKRHYDKSLRLLWKAERHASWMDFQDCTEEERQLWAVAERSLDEAQRKELDRMNSDEFRALLDREYTPRQKQALVNILALVGHGEAYAWMVSTELLNEVRSTGARAAMTMQVMEEAKHFLVLRELIRAFDCEVPRMSAWEYVLLERVFKAQGLEKFFGMNVLVEGFALSLFGMLANLPGMDILRLFHLDESRHTALPNNYFDEFPMARWHRRSPIRRAKRASLILPALPVLIQIEPDMAALGMDSFEFGGSMARKVLHLAGRVGFDLPVSNERFGRILNSVFNRYCFKTRPEHRWRDFLRVETTRGARERDAERIAFDLHAGANEDSGSA